LTTIRQVHIQNYKALKDVTLDLTPIHVLIGPNDSGKTSILEAIGAICRSVEQPAEQWFAGEWQDRDLVWSGNREGPVILTTTVKGRGREVEYKIECQFDARPEIRNVRCTRYFNGNPILLDVLEPSRGDDLPSEQLVKDNLSPSRSYHFRPQVLAMPAGRTSPAKFRLQPPSGFGLALFLDDVQGSDFDRYSKLIERFKRIFPQIGNIRYENVIGWNVDPERSSPQGESKQQGWGKEIRFQFTSALKALPASQVSDGLLLVLAYLAILYMPEPPRVLLIEEPETGIHPRRLREVIEILRELIESQPHTQVVMTTHSPYVLDSFKPEEVTLCRKEADGSVSVHRLDKSQPVKEQLDLFSLGEIWSAVGDEKLAMPAEGRRNENIDRFGGHPRARGRSC
jgi:energy-coupling factor transporter ATP-binding protein EcfA2